MAYRSILTFLDNSEQCSVWTNYAIELAKQYDAKLVAIASREIASSLYVGDLMAANSVWISELQARIDTEAEKSVEQFISWAGQHGFDDYEASVVDGSATDVLLRHAVLTDLIIVGQAGAETDLTVNRSGLVESLLLTSARPVLIVPSLGDYRFIANKVMVAWRHGRESSFALRNAIPLLRDADSVELVQVCKPGRDKTRIVDDGTAVEKYLDLHDVTARHRVIASDSAVADTLLSHACDGGIELMVMGGYGHARVREWALGGVTKTILKTMTVPVLMSH